jgi:hypothetical protein
MEVSMKVYLRQIVRDLVDKSSTTIDLFEGDIKEDCKYWKKYHNAQVRYFELKEVKIR